MQNQKQNHGQNKFEELHMAPRNTNSVLVSRGDECVIFDPWGHVDAWESLLRERGLKLRAIYVTHGHPDHIAAAPQLAQNHGVKWYMRAADNGFIGWGNDLLEYFGLPKIGGDIVMPTDLPYGNVEILPGLVARIIEAPGHTPGGVAYWFADDGVLLIGDTLFQETVGRYDLPGGNLDVLEKAIANIYAMNMSDDTRVIHGHGVQTTVGWLKQNNLFFK